ncbi:NUDIX domain-containing protein [Shewanella sedimentimangrovi]|uniref:NUDIX hydrolase n=1 Tax=Shewanella sedimentimangrovi TaxID=2814293 RepID=A0ABX7R460_9GAMM|nr:NUDIX hydrolase [Shewanella sedimentimangrovi]QSX38622.1 NUDIX hydrolase [Shewanella sedimentimangrovi]
MSEDFTGCKLAYIFEGQLLVYKHDNFSNIPFPGLLDFPGGGREGLESPEECVLRELLEEFSINLPISRLIYKKMVPSHNNDGNSFFFVTKGNQSEINSISFGDEGQYWELMPIEVYLSHPEAIPDLISRLKGYLNQ